MGNCCKCKSRLRKNKDVPVMPSATNLTFDGTAARHSGIGPGCLGIRIVQVRNVPRQNFCLSSGFCVLIQAFEGEDVATGKCLGTALSVVGTANKVESEVGTANRISTKVDWDAMLGVPSTNGGLAAKTDLKPSDWDIHKTQIKLSLCDAPPGGMLSSLVLGDIPRSAGSVTVSLRELLAKESVWLMLFNEIGDVLCSAERSFKPTELVVSIDMYTVPSTWSALAPPPAANWPRHVFMMTRGTRGDVQPFVALARGMAQQLGWLVTICTELRWKSFVLQNANVSNGRIQFVPSGGDTELQLSDPVAQFVSNAKTEMFQMLIMANTEANFYRSATACLRHVEAFDDTTRCERPVDWIIFGLTLAGIAMYIGELLDKNVIGFILQPSCIPSKEKDWRAVQHIQKHTLGLIDTVEDFMFTGHGTLQTLKVVFENNLFDKWSLNALRKKSGLQPGNTYEELKNQNIPLIIPMKEGTFARPQDWWSSITMTDFIFLRNNSGGNHGSLGEPLESFVAGAKQANAKIGLMTFSSMMVPRAKVFTLCEKMVSGCEFNLRMIYVGKKWPGSIPENVQKKVDKLIKHDRLLILERADFGELFQHMDCFIIQGGLGTTVEAGRIKKPIIVSGPLLLDQRFWGDVCFKKGIGPPATHIDNFEQIALEFVNGALDPTDPKGWQAKAREADWGEVEDDGIKSNVAGFQIFIKNLEDTGARAVPMCPTKSFTSILNDPTKSTNSVLERNDPTKSTNSVMESGSLRQIEEAREPEKTVEELLETGHLTMI